MSDVAGKIVLRLPFYIHGHKYIHIGKGFSAGPGFRLECLDKYGDDTYHPSINIGDNVCVGYDCHIGVINKIVIGNNVLVGSRVLITDHAHGNSTDIANLSIAPIDRTLFSKGPVIIDDNVWIGTGVCILPNVHIGRNSIIGANTVIVKNIPPNSVVAGEPGKTVRTIFAK